jgi:protein-arginine deiminase
MAVVSCCSALALLAACGSDTTSSPGSGLGGDASADGATLDGVVPEPDPKKPLLDLIVDANRNGVLEPKSTAEQEKEATWNDKAGASFLANLDDDDGDKLEDAFDDIVNGEADAADLSHIQLAAWPLAPDGATGTIQITGAQYVKVYRKGADNTWSLEGGVSGNCDWHTPCGNARSVINLDTAALRSGVEFGLEGVQFRMDNSWDGRVTLKLTVKDSAGAALLGQDGTDSDDVVLGVAPWLLNGNLADFDHVMSGRWTSKDEKPFNDDMTAAIAQEPRVEYETYALSAWQDQWTQDFFQTGITQIPVGEGKVQGMRVFNARPWGRSNKASALPINFLRSNILGPDVAIVAVYKKPGGTTYDSHGNHDLLPPFTNKEGKRWPLGRVIHGSGVLAETTSFYDAQRVQGPHVQVKTSWLWVGHVDEALSYIPAKNTLGWKLAVKDGVGAKAIFEKAKADGFGATKFWTGLENYDPISGNVKNAEETINSALANEDVMAWTEESHIETDGMVDVVLAETGIDETADLFYIPFLSEEVQDGGGGGKIAWQPGTVNSLVLYDHWLTPNPFGPKIDGKDMMVQDMAVRMGDPANLLGKEGTGMIVHPVDDWFGYHIQAGEVHCASNPDAPPSAKLAWWDAVQLLEP